MFNTLISSTSTSTNKPDNASPSEGDTPSMTKLSKYKNVIPGLVGNDTTDLQYNMIDQMLETEKQRNKNDAWNKLDKTQKTVYLHAFAEKYGKDNGLPVKEIKHLKSFFSECLNKSKLQKTKDVAYNKETREITSIPALYFNTTNRAFSLKMLDPKRVSTLKSLTPKRIVKEDVKTTTANDEGEEASALEQSV